MDFGLDRSHWTIYLRVSFSYLVGIFKWCLAPGFLEANSTISL